MNIEPSMVLEYGAYGVMLYLFILLIKFLCKDLREDLDRMTGVIQQDVDNTGDLKTIIGNHLLHAVNRNSEAIEKLADKIDKKFPDN